MALVTCPDCGREVSDQAPACPNCGRPLRATPPVVVKEKIGLLGKPGTFYHTVSFGCLVLLILVGIGVISMLLSNALRHTGTNPPRSAEITPQPAPDTKPLIRIREILAAKGKQIPAVLAQELGTGATVKYEKRGDEMQCVGRRGALTVEVLPVKGRVLDVVVEFNPPARDGPGALALVGLNPATSPTFNTAFVVQWHGVISGLDEVDGFYADGGAPAVKQLTVIPDKRAQDLWDKRP